MLNFLSQQEQLNDGAGPVLVIWDSALPEARFSRSGSLVMVPLLKAMQINALEGN